MTSANFIKKPIRSFDKFVEEVGRADFHQTKGQSFLILFRGQETDDPLLPRIGRPGYFSPDIDAKEENLMREFERLAYPHLDRGLLHNKWDTLALAQHNTLPTRLLDWTENPLAALWFAFIKEKSDRSPRVVWAFSITEDEIVNTNEGTPFNPGRTMAFRPNHITRTITAQSGWFTVHKLTRESKRFVPLENNTAYKGRLTKFTFEDSLRLKMLKRLDRMGINGATLFPDLYGISRYLQWKSFGKV